MSKFNCDIIKLDEVLEKHQVKDLSDLDSRLQKVQQIAELETALGLACEQIWAMSIWEDEKDDVVVDYYKFFLDKAKGIVGVKKHTKARKSTRKHEKALDNSKSLCYD